MFVDRAEIAVRGGDGGRGAVAFRREKYVPLGGPSGGDGGHGGQVWIQGDPALATLLSFQHRRRFMAQPGGPGEGSRRHGAAGEDLVIPVPLGTLVLETETHAPVADIVHPGQRALLAAGGRGGRGNARFRSSVRQAPRFAERGEPGQELRLDLELMVLADVGLLGLPNAGKSTLLGAVSAARPKIAPYPFTTLEPQLGVVRRGERELVLADIPGLIDGAHQGRGLGHDFLRHLERCRLLVHVVDGAGSEGRDPRDDFAAVERELVLFSPELARRPRVLVGNKRDLEGFDDHWPGLRRLAPTAFAISAATGEGVGPLVDALLALVAEMGPRAPLPVAGEDAEPVRTIRLPAERTWQVVRDGRGIWQVRGPDIERLVRMADLGNPEALDYLFERLVRMGLPARLRRAGAGAGDEAAVGEWVFRLGPDGVPLLEDPEGDAAGALAEAGDGPDEE